MPKFRKKPVVIEAVRWFKKGDHEKVAPASDCFSPGRNNVCGRCGHDVSDHGLISTLEDATEVGLLVCPGDWIITGVKGEHYACKPDIFAATYEPADDGA